ncbi:MAG: carbohydrate kinase [Armatimonadetes bacterium]|nr:carbohydrate kinase [Armatimonadota bacterium]
MTAERVDEILSRFPEATVAVIGDFFLDKYLILDASLTEVSLETGLDAYQVVEKRLSPGAGGTVMNNFCALDVGRVVAVGFIGDDGEGYELRREMQRRGVDLSYLIVRIDLFTPTYTKPMLRDETGQERELNRLDIKNRVPIPRDLEDAVLDNLRAVLPDVDAVVVADQVEERHLGTITDRVREEICRLARQHRDKIFFADSRGNIALFSDVIVKPNKLEAAKACGYAGPEDALTPQDALAYGAQLAARNNAPVFVTAGAEGLIVFDGRGYSHVPGIKVPPPVDIVGAGDAATAGIVAALCAGATVREAAVIGNCVASITVQQIGTTGTASRPEVSRRFREHAHLFAEI